MFLYLKIKEKIAFILADEIGETFWKKEKYNQVDVDPSFTDIQLVEF